MSQSTPLPANVLETLTKIHSLMELVGTIGRTDKNSHFNYSYRGIYTVMQHVQPALIQLGIVCSTQFDILRDEPVGSKRSVMMRSVIELIPTTTGIPFKLQGIGEGIDSGDKAAMKAASVAYREAWIKGLCIPDKDAIESEQFNPELTGNTQQSQTAAGADDIF